MGVRSFACILPLLSNFGSVISVRRDVDKGSSGVKELKNLARTSSVLQRLVSLQGQTVTPEVKTELEGVKQELDGSVSGSIQTAHDAANTAISNIVESMNSQSVKIGASLTSAKSQNAAWVKCVESEKGALEKYYQEMNVLDDMKNTAADKKRAQEAADPFSSSEAEMTLDCDMTIKGNCDELINKLKQDTANALAKVASTKTEKEGVYSAAKAAREEADQNVVTQTAKAGSQYDDTYEGLVSECAGKKSDRDTFICQTLGEQMKEGHGFDKSYNTTMEEINTPYGSLSHPDRVGEWASTKLASCLIGLFLENKPVDTDSIQTCSGGVDYATQVGSINDMAAKVGVIMASGNFPCRDGDSVRFQGNWEKDSPVQGQKRQISEYHRTDGWVAETDFSSDDSTAFTFCKN